MAWNLRACWCIGIGCLLSPPARPSEPAVAPPPHLERARLETLPDASLKIIYLRCARESDQRRLLLDEAVQCSMAADILMQRSFGGDLDALLAWWRQHRDAF